MKLVAAVAFATLIASPALAQSYNPDIGSGNLMQGPAAQGAPLVASARSRFTAHRHARGTIASRSAHRLYLYSGGFEGGDPDPNIRFQLHRESEQGRW